MFQRFGVFREISGAAVEVGEYFTNVSRSILA